MRGPMLRAAAHPRLRPRCCLRRAAAAPLHASAAARAAPPEGGERWTAFGERFTAVRHPPHGHRIHERMDRVLSTADLLAEWATGQDLRHIYLRA